MQSIETWTRDHELSSLALMCTMLVDMPDVLEVTFLHVEPRAIIKPICDFLEGFDSSVETFGSSFIRRATSLFADLLPAGDAQPIEAYGSLVLFLEIVLSRFDVRRASLRAGLHQCVRAEFRARSSHKTWATTLVARTRFSAGGFRLYPQCTLSRA